MLSFLPSFLRGVISLVLFALSTVAVSIVALLIMLFSFLIFIPSWKDKYLYITQECFYGLWVEANERIMRLTTKTEWDIQGTKSIDQKKWYLLICNHQSWLDILVLDKSFIHKVPMLRFFMKRSLLWKLPLAGIACWALGYPFVTRYSKEYLKKHPEKEGEDLEKAKKACEKFHNIPATIVNYVEGTRLTPEKHRKQASPYQHLLKPRAGGLAFTIAAMAKNRLDGIINVTIVYPNPKTSLWQFMCGKTRKIIVRYELLPITSEICGDYFHNTQFRHQFQEWLNQLWQEKDHLISQLLILSKGKNYHD